MNTTRLALDAFDVSFPDDGSRNVVELSLDGQTYRCVPAYSLGTAAPVRDGYDVVRRNNAGGWSNIGWSETLRGAAEDCLLDVQQRARLIREGSCSTQ